MKKLLICLLALATVAFAENPPPDAGGRAGNSFIITVTDTDVDASWELIDGALGANITYSPMSTDTTIGIAYANQTWYDSLTSGNAGASTPIGIWLLASSADASSYANGFSAHGVPAYKAAKFGNGYSSKVGTDLYRSADTDFRLATGNFTLAFWAKSPKTANPSAIQTIFSTYTSPDRVKVRYLTTGKLNVTWSDGSTTSVLCPTGPDSISTTADVYDSTWHYFALQRASTVLSLYQDGARVANTTIVNSGSVDPDTVQIGAFRAATRLVGMVDEVFYVKAALDTMLIKYAYLRGQGIDTAKVHVSGIKDSDSTYRKETVNVPLNGIGATAVNYHAFEGAYLDTAEAQAIIVFKNAASPHASAYLDSIIPGNRWNPIGHRLFGYGDQPVIEKAIFTNNDTLGVFYQLRVYNDVGRAISYTSNYYTACEGYMDRGGNPIECDFGKADEGRGLYIGEGTYVAGYAKGLAANSNVTMTLMGVRKR